MPDIPALQFDHVGLVVAELRVGREHLARSLGISRWTEEFDDSGLGVRVQFGTAESGPAIELIAPLGETSPVAQALRTGQRVLNHIAYLTEDLAGSGRVLAEEGFVATGPAQPAAAYGGRAVQFFVSPLRFIVELIEAPGHVHVYADGMAKSEAGA